MLYYCSSMGELQLLCFDEIEEVSVMFKWNVLLDLSGGAVTKAFCSLVTEFLL